MLPRILVSLLSIVVLSCGPGSTIDNGKQRYRTGKSDFDRMLALSLTIAEELLRHDESFVPFAAAVKTNGELAGVLAIEPELTTSGAVDRTLGELVRGARTGLYRSTAMCTDVLVPPTNGRGDKRGHDAISILLEDETESRGFILPYSRDTDGTVTFGTPYFSHEKSLVFRRVTAL